MIFSSPCASYIPQKPGWKGIYEKIEAAARTCYKSEGYTRYDENGDSMSAREFAEKILNVYKHRSVAEHATVYMIAPKDHILALPDEFWKYSKLNIINDTCYISTNYRAILDNDLKQFMMTHMVNEPTEHHTKAYSIRVFTDRGVSAELNRHRHNSPSERSTRYVDSKDNFVVVMPEDYQESMIKVEEFWSNPESGFGGCLEFMCNGILQGELNFWSKVDWWFFANLATERAYIEMRERGASKQEARRVLPFDIETELAITAYEDDWKHFFDLRLKQVTGSVHPDMLRLTKLMAQEFIPVMGWLKSYLTNYSTNT